MLQCTTASSHLSVEKRRRRGARMDVDVFVVAAAARVVAGGAVTAMARARAVADTATVRETATAAMSSDRRRGPAIPPVEWAKMTRSQRKHYMKNHKVKR